MKITVYSKDNCQQCRATERKLDSKGLSYEYIDMTDNPEAIAAAKELGHLAAPVVLVEQADGTATNWSGFRPDLIDNL